MKTYTTSAVAAIDYKHAHPERTGHKNAVGFLNFWPNRASLARTIRMQERAGTPNAWRAVQPLCAGHSYKARYDQN
jgi:hypothetical protein